MNRSEAKGVPNILVASVPPPAVGTELYAEFEQGYYADGAYTAVPGLFATRPGCGVIDEDLDPQEAYYASLCDRFDAMSSALRLPPPVSSTGQSSTHNPCSRAEWRRLILYTQPTSVILSLFRQEELMQGLVVLESLVSMANLQKYKFVGVWAWGLLAKCRDVGEMGSEEVGVLRDLGKKAIAVIRGVVAGLYKDLEPSSENGEDENKDKHEEAPAPAVTVESLNPSEDGITVDLDNAKVPANPVKLPPDSPDPLAAAKQRVLDCLGQASPEIERTEQTLKAVQTQPQLHPQEVESKVPESEESRQSPHNNNKEDGEDEKPVQTHAALDMIITIVGERYGQKDLLQGRFLWDEMESLLGFQG